PAKFSAKAAHRFMLMSFPRYRTPGRCLHAVALESQLDMSILDTFVGKPLATSQGEEEKIGVASGVSVLGLDGLSSAAYGPEAALTILIPLGAIGPRAITPVTALILVL